MAVKKWSADLKSAKTSQNIKPAIKYIALVEMWLFETAQTMTLT
jgi:hypothetical protein